ncbi:hypothetical protein GCM10016272_13550 [Psychrobacter glaciei]|uniref:Uncharacterized protein n=1 Tax=Psychrobacter glaciei TaxID=619771 RepID=A0ABQ3GQ47_9GAMM|nr:hypothetical protein [Psychrobacter glaciei]GHD31454.1 hypothetical protein GCM10016272_13550 [Psychrobacter glaciei]
MSNNNAKNDAAENSKKSTNNKAVTGVEVVREDTVVFEDGDFEAYNAEHDYEEAKDDSTAKSDMSDKASKNKDSDKNQKSNKDDKSNSDDKDAQSDKNTKDSKSNQKDKTSKKDNADQEDKSSITMAGIYQWASKLKDDFKSDASGMTQDVSEKATAMMLGKLLDAVDLELAAFDKSLDVAKNLVATAEERRKKIAAKKEKYQGMIDKLDQE